MGPLRGPLEKYTLFTSGLIDFKEVPTKKIGKKVGSIEKT
jgi:hypothetical protein